MRVTEKGVTFLSDTGKNLKEKNVFSDVTDAPGRGRMYTVICEKRFVQGGTVPRFLLEKSVPV